MDEQGYPVADTTNWHGVILLIILVAIAVQVVVGLLVWRSAVFQERVRAAKARADVAARFSRRSTGSCRRP